MRKVIGGLCCFIVALQALVGVPLLVCTAFFCLAQGGSAPFVVRWDFGPRPAATIAPSDYPPPYSVAANPPVPLPAPLPPPRNIIPEKPAGDHPILQTRAAQGSPLAGTVLASPDDSHEEQELFLAALAQAEAACVDAQCHSAGLESCETAAAIQPVPVDSIQQLRTHLYQMAELDEQAGRYERADQWRALARELQTGDAES